MFYCIAQNVGGYLCHPSNVQAAPVVVIQRSLVLPSKQRPPHARNKRLEQRCHRTRIVEKAGSSENLGEMAVICGFDEGDALVDRRALNEICSCGSFAGAGHVQGYPAVAPQQETTAGNELTANRQPRRRHRAQSWSIRITVCLPLAICHWKSTRELVCINLQ